MKFSFIVIGCYTVASAAAFASLGYSALTSRGLSQPKDERSIRSRISKALGFKKERNELKTPLLGKAVSASAPTKASARVSAKSGPGFQSTMYAANGYFRGDSKYSEVSDGQSGSMSASHHIYTKVGGWPTMGGQTDMETTANRVKVKMNIIHPSLGIVKRKHKDGRWSEDVLSDEGIERKYFKNDDGSPVTVKASLLGGGRLRMTGDQSLPRLKANRSYEPNE